MFGVEGGFKQSASRRLSGTHHTTRGGGAGRRTIRYASGGSRTSQLCTWLRQKVLRRRVATLGAARPIRALSALGSVARSTAKRNFVLTVLFR